MAHHKGARRGCVREWSPVTVFHKESWSSELLQKELQFLVALCLTSCISKTSNRESVTYARSSAARCERYSVHFRQTCSFDTVWPRPRNAPFKSYLHARGIISSMFELRKYLVAYYFKETVHNYDIAEKELLDKILTSPSLFCRLFLCSCAIIVRFFCSRGEHSSHEFSWNSCTI